MELLGSSSGGVGRIIEESVPGKQVTIAHVIASPMYDIYERLGIDEAGAIGILTLSPYETAIIAADIATKAAETVNAKFVSIDLLEESGSHDLMVLELNAGVAMDQFIIKNPDGRKIAYSIYEKSIKNMFHCN